MRHHRSAIFSGAIALASLIAIGTGATAGAAPTYGAATTPSKAASVATGHIQRVGTLATLHTTTAIVNGKSQSILVDAKGLPLYYFKGDTAKSSNVSGKLLRLWPALVATHPVGTGTTGRLTALQNANGHQVAYNGRFLYTFVADTPGHVTGQGVSGFFVATSHLKPISGSTPTAATTTSSGSHGYGY